MMMVSLGHLPCCFIDINVTLISSCACTNIYINTFCTNAVWVCTNCVYDGEFSGCIYLVYTLCEVNPRSYTMSEGTTDNLQSFFGCFSMYPMTNS